MKIINKRKFLKDALIIAISIFFAIIFAKSAFLRDFILRSDGIYILDSFVAGLFFTSVFTTAPAIVVLASLSSAYNPFVVAIVGALGSMVGDIIIMNFLKNHVSNDIDAIIAHSKSGRLRHIMKYRFARWSLVLLGALIIASPFPDELGLTLMGLSKISLRRFALISFIFNVLGILAIGFVAKAI